MMFCAAWQPAAVLAGILLAIVPIGAAAKADSARVLDDFSAPKEWTAVSSDQVEAHLRVAREGDQPALCLDFDFHGVSGYAGMRRRLPIDYPANYDFTFRVRGDAPDNALQFKLNDTSGDNVWWVNRPDFTFPHDWTAQRYRKRQVDFAWGPTKDRALRHSDGIEFTVYAGNGGRGSVCFADLRLQERPVPPAHWPAPLARASSAVPDAPAANAVDGDVGRLWRSRRSGEQQLTIDLGATREFGGLVLRWANDAFASRYDIELSDDGRHWRRVRHVDHGNGGVDPLLLPESEARFVRIRMHAGPSTSYALAEVEIKDLAFGASANSFFGELARSAPRGRYPRGFYDEQTYWTVVGTDGGHETGLFSEDGALEVARGGFSIEPFLALDAAAGAPPRVLGWADVDIAHSLLDGYLPIPAVHWRGAGIALDIETFAAPAARNDSATIASNLYASYTVRNTGDKPLALTLALLVRPFQVNPAVQFLNTPGGISPIHDLEGRGPQNGDAGAVIVDGKPRVFPLATPDAFEASAFDSGMAVDHLGDAQPDRPHAVHDDTGFASGALRYRVELEPGASRTFALQIPLDGEPIADPAAPDAAARIAARRREVVAYWREALGRVDLHVPASAGALRDTLRTALAHILINRDGAAIRPGTRSYARSWIRDGAMTSDALLRLGHADAARAYLEWYAPFQFRNGKVPCCVDQRGSDPVPENDSQGELIHLVDAVYRHTGDRALLEAMWPHVDAAARYMDELRMSERSEANRSGERRAFYGLMPASISHEGYSAKPMHSYWDDFWALAGYKEAVDIASALGKHADATRLAASRDEFRNDLYASIRTAVADHHVDYLPGCAELGDFDATSTTIALSPAGEQARLPQDLLHATFERYWSQFVARRDGGAWKDYTPYEWRTVGAFVRLGWRDRARSAIDFFMHDRRPTEWNQWAEVVGRDPRESRFIGDMPHGWVASDFIRSTLDLFAYERESDQSLVLAAGVPADWLDGDGIAIEGLRTRYGTLGYSLKRDASGLSAHLGGNLRMPPGGIELAAPGLPASGHARVDGQVVRIRDGRLMVPHVPADITVELPDARR